MPMHGIKRVINKSRDNNLFNESDFLDGTSVTRGPSQKRFSYAPTYKSNDSRKSKRSKIDPISRSPHTPSPDSKKVNYQFKQDSKEQRAKLVKQQTEKSPGQRGVKPFNLVKDSQMNLTEGSTDLRLDNKVRKIKTSQTSTKDEISLRKVPQTTKNALTYGRNSPIREVRNSPQYSPNYYLNEKKSKILS